MNEEERKELVSKFWTALRADNREGMKTCLEIDSTIVDEPNPGGYSALGYAAWDVSEETATWLLDQGANSGCAHAFGGANVSNYPKLLKRMIAEADFEPEQITDGLAAAARRASHDTMRVLLEHGADPNARAANGEGDGMGWRCVWHRAETPLHRAASRLDVKAARILRDAGADPSIKDAREIPETPLSWFSRMLGPNPDKGLKPLNWQRTRSRESEPPTPRSARFGTLEEMGKLLEYEGREPTPDYESPLLNLAVESGDVEKVRSLLAAGEDANAACTMTGETPLHQAATFNQTEIAKLLLAAGANPNAKTKVGVPTKTFWRDVEVIGETPLHRASGYSCLTLITALMEAGADGNITDANSEFALTWFSRMINWSHSDMENRSAVGEVIASDDWKDRV